jgi:DUF1365 family protein
LIPPPGLYSGSLRHRRFAPRAHAFTYGVCMAWLDIDRIAETLCRSRWTSYNRFNWASFDQRDHFGDPSLPLRERLTRDAQAHAVTLPDGPIYLLTHLRYFGYCFNPISFYYCYDRSGALDTVLAEVNNTFGEHHNYWLTAGNRQPGARLFRYRCEKAMHVSPFMDMPLDYEFTLSAPSGALVAHMTTAARETASPSPALFDATLTLTHEPWTPRAVRAALWRHPWMTVKVIAAIHWQALRLYVKGLPVFTHPDRRT